MNPVGVSWLHRISNPFHRSIPRKNEWKPFSVCRQIPKRKKSRITSGVPIFLAVGQLCVHSPPVLGAPLLALSQRKKGESANKWKVDSWRGVSRKIAGETRGSVWHRRAGQSLGTLCGHSCNKVSWGGYPCLGTATFYTLLTVYSTLYPCFEQDWFYEGMTDVSRWPKRDTLVGEILQPGLAYCERTNPFVCDQHWRKTGENSSGNDWTCA